MSNLELTKELSKSIFDDDYPSELGIDIVEVGDWEDNGKYQHKTFVFSHTANFYSFTVSRCGSWFTDYEYLFESPEPVVKEERVVKKTFWLKVK